MIWNFRTRYPILQAAPPPGEAANFFHVVREETAPFPGDWEPLRSKNVKLITVQKIDESAKESGSPAQTPICQVSVRE